MMNTALSAIIEPLRFTRGSQLVKELAGTGATFHYERPGSVCFRFMPRFLKGVSLVLDVQDEI